MSKSSNKSIYKLKLFWFAIIYIGLLVWSGIYRYNTPEPAISQDKKAVFLQTIDGGKKLIEKTYVSKIFERRNPQKNN